MQSKAIEYFIAPKIIYLSDAFNLFLKNHFGNLKDQSKLYALIILQKKFTRYKDIKKS